MSTVEEQTIGSCPHCGGDDTSIEESERGDGTWYDVGCETCLTTGPIEPSEASAIANWNRLSTAAALARAVDKIDKQLGTKELYSIEVDRDSDGRVYLMNVGYSEVMGTYFGPLAAALIALAGEVGE